MFPTEFIVRLIAASIAGGALGLERESSRKSAGLRTNIIVSVGASIYVMISAILMENGTTGDPSRVMGQVVTGIGFLGAGVIMTRGSNVKGLTTAATIWCSAALGCLAGFGLFWELSASTVLIILVNTGLRKVDVWFVKKQIKSEVSEKNKEEDTLEHNKREDISKNN